MFHLSDYAIAARDLAIFESGALVDAHGHIAFPGEKFTGKGAGLFNACDIYLKWDCEQNYGVQRVRVGRPDAVSAAVWRKLLESHDKKAGCDKLTRYAAERANKVEAVFPGQQVVFEVLGWRLVNVKFWKPGKAIKIPAAKSARVRFFAEDNNATPHIPSTLAKASNGKKQN